MAFSVRSVDARLAQQLEPLGSKPKFWFENNRFLFKADARGTGADWAEVIVAQLCRLLGLPHVDYELAVEVEGLSFVRNGVVCRNLSPPPKSLILGNQLLFEIDPNYPTHQRFRVRQHTVGAVLDVVEALDLPESIWTANLPADLSNALDVFIGYVMLDAWVANQDRHHENWGAVRSGVGDEFWLAPTFDHGAALANILRDEERRERLSTHDHNRTLEAFVERGQSCFFESSSAGKPLRLIDAFESFAIRRPLARATWLRQLRTVSQSQVFGIVSEIPDDRMSLACRDFTLRLLDLNRQRLLALEKME